MGGRNQPSSETMTIALFFFHQQNESNCNTTEVSSKEGVNLDEDVAFEHVARQDDKNHLLRPSEIQ